MATGPEVRTLLANTTLPRDLVDDLIAGASPVWLMGEPAHVIAADMALCHPPLCAGEVRAAIHPTADADAWRLSVVASDRNGLLACIAGALTTHGLSVLRVSANAWSDHGLALLRIVASGAAGDEEWQRVGTDLQDAIRNTEISAPVFEPRPPVKVAADVQTGGRTLLRVSAPDRPGLLWAVAAWLAAQGCNIEVAKADGDGQLADDTFVVDGEVDARALATHLSGSPGGDDAAWWLRVGQSWWAALRGRFSG
ncbi:MAG: ACT domain-containing protein [Acidimicrobiales bacterium]